MDGHRMGERRQPLRQLPTLLPAVDMDGEIVADDVEIPGEGRHREQALGGPWLAAVDPGPRCLVPEDAAGRMAEVRHPRPVVVAGRRVQRVPVDDEGADTMVAVRRHLAQVLPVGAARMAEDVSEVGLGPSVGAARVQPALEDRQRGHVVRRRGGPPAVDPARLGARIKAERDAQLVPGAVVAARAGDRAQAEPRPCLGVESRGQAAGRARPMLGHVDPEGEAEVAVQVDPGPVVDRRRHVLNPSWPRSPNRR